jgi:hypothetical protein
MSACSPSATTKGMVIEAKKRFGWARSACVNETGWNGVVMNDKENGIDWMIGMETVKNG